MLTINQLQKGLKIFLTLAAIAVFSTAFIGSEAMAQQNTQQGTQQRPAPPDPKQIFGGQAPMKESELLQFLDDFVHIKKLKDEQKSIQYLISRGWSGPRFTYVAAKTALTRDIIRRGGGTDVINRLPVEARPQKGEIELVRKHMKRIDSMSAPAATN